MHFGNMPGRGCFLIVTWPSFKTIQDSVAALTERTNVDRTRPFPAGNWTPASSLALIGYFVAAMVNASNGGCQ